MILELGRGTFKLISLSNTNFFLRKFFIFLLFFKIQIPEYKQFQMARKRKANFVVGETKNHQMNGSASSVSILPTSSGNEDQKKEKELKWTPQLRRIATQLHLDRADREKITIWRRPLTTFHYFFRELICLTGDCSVW